jgi:putative spermidine/putrescine transport system permease protein
VAGQDGLALSGSTASETSRPGPAPGRRRLSLAWLGVVPFFAYALFFLFIPAGNVIAGAFKDVKGGFTFQNVQDLFQTQYLNAYKTSIEVSLVTALLGGALGLAIAYAAVRDGTPRWVRSGMTTFSGVAANFGGIPLAFAFIATLGTIGIATQFLNNVFGVNIYESPINFTLFSKTGVEIAYLYFQIPLMILVIAPAIDGLRREWREAASNLGASSWQFWRHVGFPILMPSILGATILLFGNSFAAYATAYGLTGGGAGVNLVPIVIGNYYTGNVFSNPHLAQALAFGMFVVLAAMMLLYIPLQRRASRWAK